MEYYGKNTGKLTADPFKLELPVQGIEAKDWVVNYFVDHSPSRQQYTDFKGGRKSYCGHTGTDFNIPNFRWMDRGLSVIASASGTVTEWHDGEPDRNTCRLSSQELRWNYVKIEHDNGFTTLYGHLKGGSVSVRCGQHVDVGERIGLVGSSGYSDGPHLHFELRDEEGRAVDPFKEECWIKSPMYNPPFSVMDFSVQVGKEKLDESKAPPIENVESFYSDDVVTVGVFMSGLRANRRVWFGLQVGDQLCCWDKTFRADEIENHMIVFAHLRSDSSGVGGIAVFVDEERVCTHMVEVRAPVVGRQR